MEAAALKYGRMFKDFIQSMLAQHYENESADRFLLTCIEEKMQAQFLEDASQFPSCSTYDTGASKLQGDEVLWCTIPSKSRSCLGLRRN